MTRVCFHRILKENVTQSDRTLTRENFDARGVRKLSGCKLGESSRRSSGSSWIRGSANCPKGLNTAQWVNDSDLFLKKQLTTTG